MNSQLRFERQRGRLLVIGELDLATVPELHQALRAEDDDVVLDIGGLEFIDSSGIHALLQARRARPGMRVENPTAAIRRVFDLTGATALLLDDETAGERI